VVHFEIQGYALIVIALVLIQLYGLKFRIGHINQCPIWLKLC